MIKTVLSRPAGGARLIAHHGYQRPGDGWQTSSCFGARWRPYEIASDALPAAIEQTEAFLALARPKLAALLSAPPASLPVEVRHRDRASDWIDAPRPAGFDPTADSDGYSGDDYVCAFRVALYEAERDVSRGERDLTGLKKRLADWPAYVAALDKSARRRPLTTKQHGGGKAL